MNRSDLIRAVAARRGIARKTAEAAVTSVFDGIREALCDGRRVEIRGFGTLHARHYPAYVGRNPRTGAAVRVEEKVLPVFRIGKSLREKLRANEEEESCSGG